jgi:hypothetical protein
VVIRRLHNLVVVPLGVIALDRGHVGENLSTSAVRALG